jgi:aminodeoxyfutalosine synthase
MSTADLVRLIKQVKREPIERGTLYNEIKNYAAVTDEELTN